MDKLIILNKDSFNYCATKIYKYVNNTALIVNNTALIVILFLFVIYTIFFHFII